MSKRILVTGGAGFVGTHLVAHLVDRGDDVVVVDSLEPQVHLGHEPVFPDGVSFIHGDVGDPVAADRALEGVDAWSTWRRRSGSASRCTRSNGTSA